MTRHRDNQFVAKIGQEICKQQELNDDDFSLVITKDQIRENTGRVKVRDVVLDEYANDLSTMPGVAASVQGNKVVIKAKSEVNQVFQEKYGSINDLIKSNSLIQKENGNE